MYDDTSAHWTILEFYHHDKYLNFAKSCRKTQKKAEKTLTQHKTEK